MKWTFIVILALCSGQLVHGQIISFLAKFIQKPTAKAQSEGDYDTSNLIVLDDTSSETIFPDASTRFTSLLNPISWFQTATKKRNATAFNIDDELDTVSERCPARRITFRELIT